MTAKIMMIAVAAFVLVAGNAQAQLGWTDHDCYNKWGDPFSTRMNLGAGTLECLFDTGSDLRVQIDFQGDKANNRDLRVQSIVYSSASRKFLSAHAMKLLQANYAGHWQLYNDKRGKATIHTWKVNDPNGNEAAYAIFQRSNNGDGRYTLQVGTGDFDRYINSHGEPQ